MISQLKHTSFIALKPHPLLVFLATLTAAYPGQTVPNWGGIQPVAIPTTVLGLAWLARLQPQQGCRAAWHCVLIPGQCPLPVPKASAPNLGGCHVASLQDVLMSDLTSYLIGKGSHRR